MATKANSTWWHQNNLITKRVQLLNLPCILKRVTHAKLKIQSLFLEQYIYIHTHKATCSQSAPNFPTANLPSWRVTTAVPTFKTIQNNLSHLHHPMVQAMHTEQTIWCTTQKWNNRRIIYILERKENLDDDALNIFEKMSIRICVLHILTSKLLFLFSAVGREERESACEQFLILKSRVDKKVYTLHYVLTTDIHIFFYFF